MILTLTQLVKNNRCYFSYFRQGKAFYTVDYCFDEEPTEISHIYTYGFNIPIDDIGQATLGKEEKAILLMRWIRKALENNELILVNVATKYIDNGK